MRKFWSSDINRAVIARAAPAPGETALDIGAGMGAAVFDAARLVGRHGRVLAVEPTPFMRRVLAVRRLASPHRRRVEILDGVAEDMPVPAESVDVAWAVNVLHHIGDLERAVADLARVMAPGGRVIMIDEDFEDPTHPDHEKRARRGPVHHGGDRHHGVDEHGHHHLMVEVDALATTMRAHGFDPVEGRSEVVASVPTRMVTAARRAG